ncbi:hypothetical protein L916_04992 [Phytophthora nicotianae]|uniref:Uncharacterized protein n=2 Tax=Phytophthora nicotianae TaxID=4792 RepID=W2JEA8_PHYNI|nr:hypothetical protein L916_04992 [Phytophthora nicotianae]
MARHQVRLSLAPPLHREVASQRRLDAAVGFDDVLAVVPTFPDSLESLPRQLGELQPQLRSAEADAAAAKCAVVPEMMTRENAEQLLKLSNAQAESLRAEIKRVKNANVKMDALLTKSKEATDTHTEDLKLLRVWIQGRDDSIAALEKQLVLERDTFKASIAANTEQTRQLHAILVSACKGTYVDTDTTKSIEDLQRRYTHLLKVNRALRSHVSLTGMDPDILVLAVQGLRAGELDLDSLDLGQESLVALQHIQAETESSSDPQALLALSQTLLTKSLTASPASVFVQSPAPTDKASSAMSAAGLGDEVSSDSSSQRSVRRGLHKPKSWKKQKKRRRTHSETSSPAASRTSRSPSLPTPRAHLRTPPSASAKSPRGRQRSRSLSVPARPPSGSKMQRNVEMSDDQAGGQASVPAVTTSSADDRAVSPPPDDASKASPVVTESPARDEESPGRASPSPPAPATVETEVEDPDALEAAELRLMFGSDDEDEAPGQPASTAEDVPTSAEDSSETRSEMLLSTLVSSSRIVSMGDGGNGESRGDNGGTGDDDKFVFDFPAGDTGNDEDVPPGGDDSEASESGGFDLGPPRPPTTPVPTPPR